MATYEEAAQQLGITRTSIERRMRLLGMKARIGDDGRADIDPEEIERRWQERLPTVTRPEARFTESLVVSIRPDQRAVIDQMVAERDTSAAAVTRELLDHGIKAQRQP